MVKLNIVNNGLVEVPFDDNLPTIEVTNEQFEQIKNGQLRYENGKLVDNTDKLNAYKRIAELKQKLADTDYVDNKLIETFITGNTEKLEELKQTYAQVLVDRQSWRAEINELEKQLK